MRSYSLLLCLGSVALLAAQIARADAPVRCPDGQAVQSIGAGGKDATCVPVPAPVDLGAVNAAIAAEAAARLAGDTGEAVARMQADQEIRDSLTESGLSGRYAVVGIANCLRSTGGFRTDLEFVPAVSPGSQVQPQSFTYTGTRTVDGNVMHGSSLVYSLTYPSTFFQSPSSFQSGGGTVVQVAQDHSIGLGADHTLTLTGLGSHGVFLRGSNLVGGTVDTVGAPALTGKISKDGRTIVLTNAEMAVEMTTTTPPGGTPSSLQRVCTRMETLYKLAD